MKVFAVESIVRGGHPIDWSGFDLFATKELAIEFAKHCVHCAKVNNPDLVVEAEFTEEHQQFKGRCAKSGKFIFVRILCPHVHETVPRNFYSWW